MFLLLLLLAFLLLAWYFTPIILWGLEYKRWAERRQRRDEFHRPDEPTR